MESNRTLTDILKDRISSCSKITFAEFMDMALYHPIMGYYSSERVKIGKEGDYYTSPFVHSVFGELICKQIEEMWRATGGREFYIMEMGAGDGSLSYDILKCARERYPYLYEALQYIVIEESAYMRKRQRERLLSHAKVIWVDTTDPLFTEGVTGCFLSNELVDSFPVHIVEKRGGELREVFVSLYNNTFVEVIDSLSSPEIKRYFDLLGIDLEEGQRAEVNLRAVEWMRWVARALKKGFVITIDYGYPAEELYAPHRKDGTLLCYYRHRVVEDPFINIGEQDMTAHVDFTTLMMTGEEEGIKVSGLTDQMHFLFGLGIGKRIEAIEFERATETDVLKERLVIKNLIMPGRMGNIFKVLIQYKGLDEKPILSGLRKDPVIF